MADVKINDLLIMADKYALAYADDSISAADGSARLSGPAIDDLIERVRASLDPDPVLVHCGYCNGWAAIQTMCVHCGAPVG